MPDFQKIPYYDLPFELKNNRLPPCIGREMEISRMLRTVRRSLQPHVALIGPSGIGTSSLIYGFVKSAAAHDQVSRRHIVQLETGAMQKISSLTGTSLAYYHDAVAHITDSVVILDDFGNAIFSQQNGLTNWLLLLKPLMERNDSSIIIVLTPEQFQMLQRNAGFFTAQFEQIQVGPQPAEEIKKIVSLAGKKLGAKAHGEVREEAIDALLQFMQRFPSLGQPPKAAIQILDEVLIEAQNEKILPHAITTHPAIRHMEITKAQARKKNITPELIAKIISEKTGVPLQNFSQNEKEMLKTLPALLNSRIIGQTGCMATISSVIQRAKLGLKSQSRPLASFLFLGPSGVGKTETAKLLADYCLAGHSNNFLRIDMSEFMEAHTVQRLIGAPPGYSGFDSGGQLTNHLKNFPYSLILLDEIEKAHPKIFDIFLQVLDDGRLSSGQGETVDATQAIFVATSNLGVTQILENYGSNDQTYGQSFIKNSLFPILLQHFRAEFLNRFDAILPFKPLSVEDLLRIAQLEIKKIETRVKKHNITFTIDPAALETQIQTLADPRFGARPVKRFIEELCENKITEQLLN